jgi:hypothetical protein
MRALIGLTEAETELLPQVFDVALPVSVVPSNGQDFANA